ncbi:MAG: TonB-dependent receptor plug domain-containing protein [Bacteroidales bacterium]
MNDNIDTCTNIKRGLLLIVLLVLVNALSAQVKVSGLLDSVEYRFSKQASLYPQEKIYVQIDKSFYITGEYIWFRAHLVDAMSNIPDTTSRYIYAELINPLDSVVVRVKVRPQDGAYSGYIPLAEELPEGDYQLQFYTRFMEGLGSEYFFKRALKIGDPLGALYRTEASFEYRDNNKKIDVELRFFALENGESVKPDKIQISDNKGVRTHRQNEDGTVRTSINTPTEKINRVIYVEYDVAGKFHKQFIHIPFPDDFEVSFLPEGGNLPAGVMNCMAFKALNSEGLGEDISGVVVNNNGDTIVDFKSQHRGMGQFLLLFNNTSDKYTAICRNKKGVEKRYELPSADLSCATLRTQQQKDHLYIAVNKSIDVGIDEQFYLIIQSKGVLLYAAEWDNSKELVMLEKDILPSGVIQILLADKELNILSERLFFNVNKINLAKMNFSSDKENYDRRQKINASISLSDIKGEPGIANFSVSITDDNDISPDTCVNILSSLLLTSDLRGYIEAPAYYFSDSSLRVRSDLDLLMMTQGWSRYDIPKVLKGIYDVPKSYLELSQEISGALKGGLLSNKLSAGYPVSLIATQAGLFGTTTTNEHGHFCFRNFEMPDSIKYVVQGQTRKGGKGVELIVNPETFPEAKYSLPFSPLSHHKDFGNFLQKADRQFELVNGVRMIYLKGVEVSAKKTDEKGRSTYSSAMNPRFTEDEIEQMHARSMLQILSRFAGVMVTGNNISIRGGGAPLILLDDIEIDVDLLESIPVESVDEVEIVKDAGAAIFGSRGGNGVIMVSTKEGEGIATLSRSALNIKNISPLGYQRAKDFYSPQYQTVQQRARAVPDMRTTIYWNPSLKTADDGSVDFSFYSSDASSKYSVVIEGVTSKGLLIHSVESIYRTD